MKYFPLLLTLLFSYFLEAQESKPENPNTHNHYSLSASGGDAYGSGGSVAFSVGQTFYHSFNDSKNTLSEGIQQPILDKAEEETPPVVEEIKPPVEETNENQPKDLKIEVIAYPNPMTEFFIIEIANFKDEGYYYQFFDMNGKILKLGTLENRRTKISPDYLQSAMYILKVFKEDRNIKTLKIIKR
ncbi:T9SS type A sorting domain-containing protein [Autumnicola edwardsiae]|uniref:T9SS type A sorting domain-containing protein n=1 Tax=Autumnicola edwardsiae TaxID=3075594 RepID=A0ABU3CV20_9FLAO|nr:T9SS type A sorting domain-containing protein [Zunongwangia sp. F297]MDT0650126.1 T9SS type A sorting domain-containing protein [Zunongwangia sp. F297]